MNKEAIGQFRIFRSLSGRGFFDFRSDEQIKQGDYNLGQQDGSDADTIDQVGHELVGRHIQTDDYNEGYEHGTRNQPDDE